MSAVLSSVPNFAREDGGSGHNSDLPARQRITPSAFFAALLALYIFAVGSAVVRTAVRWRHYRILTASDYMCIISCTTLTVSVGVTLSNRAAIYGSVDAAASHQPQAPSDAFSFVFNAQILPWVTIYVVKGAFIMVFRQLVRGIRVLERWWWITTIVVVIGFLATVGVLSLLGVFVGKAANPRSLPLSSENMQTVYVAVTICADAITDAFLVSVPVRLVWRLQTRLLAKFTVGSILSLSIVMIGIATIRVAFGSGSGSAAQTVPNLTTGRPIGVNLDIIWFAFWQIVEAEVAVIMLSLTIVRALVRNSSQSGDMRVERGVLPREDPEQASMEEMTRHEAPLQGLEAVGQSKPANLDAESIRLGRKDLDAEQQSKRDGWTTPKRQRSKLRRKASQASMLRVADDARRRKKVVAKSEHSTQTRSSTKSRILRFRHQSGDSIFSSNWTKSPRQIGGLMSANSSLRRSPRRSPRRSLQRSGSSRHLIGNEEAPDVNIDLTMDFAAVWAAPPPNLRLSRKHRDKTITAVEKANKPGSGIRGQGRDLSGDLDEDFRLEEARQAEEDRKRWLMLVKKFENEKPLPPPVARPTRIIQMNAMHHEQSNVYQKAHAGSAGSERDLSIPGGMF